MQGAAMRLRGSARSSAGVAMRSRLSAGPQQPRAAGVSCFSHLPSSRRERETAAQLPISSASKDGSPPRHAAFPGLAGRAASLLSCPPSSRTARLPSTSCRASSDAAASSPGSPSSAPVSLTPVLTAVAIACAGAFAFGYNLGVVNGPLEQIATELGFLGDKAKEGLVVSSTLAGAALGSLTGGGLSDALGRRASFLLAALPMAAGPLLSAAAGDLNGMVAGRFLAGLAIGLSSALVPTYISEVAPTSIRGTLGALNQLCICLGILAALLVNVGLPASSWRAMFTLAAVPAALLGLGMLFSPESPRWLSSKGRDASATAAATKLWGPQGAAELGPSSAAVAAASAKAGGGAAAAEPASTDMRPIVMGMTLFALQQFAGINALVYFSSSVFKQAGVTSGALASAAVGATNVLGTLVAASLMERAGRKSLLVNSFMGQAAAMFVMAASFSLPALQPYAGPIAVGGTLAYILAFALGAGPVPALIVPELNPVQTRGKAVAAAFVSHWVCNVVVGQSFLGAVATHGLSKVYVFFGLVALAAAAYVGAQIPETKGKSLDQIQEEMRARR